MIAEQRIYRTADGGLTTSEADAAFLAYAVGDEVPSAVVAELAGPADKQAEKPADKAVRGPRKA